MPPRLPPPTQRSVFPASAAGPVAALRDDAKLVLYVGSFAKPDLQLYTAAGAPTARILWDRPARLLAAGWTSAERLVVVDDAAQVGGCRDVGEWCVPGGGAHGRLSG